MRIKIILVSLVFCLAFTALVNLALASGSYGLDDTVKVGNVGAALNVKQVAAAGTPGQFLSSKVGQIIGSILAFIGVIFFILVIYAGFKWMISSGNEKTVGEAKNLLISAVIGLIIVLSAYSITAFVGRQLTTTNSPSK
ncbi:MAG: hypothetical protein WCK37_04220 [Candidatus Falkowbacteria bacterium]